MLALHHFRWVRGPRLAPHVCPAGSGQPHGAGRRPRPQQGTGEKGRYLRRCWGWGTGTPSAAELHTRGAGGCARGMQVLGARLGWLFPVLFAPWKNEKPCSVVLMVSD